MIDEAIGQLTPIVGTTAALASVGADRATWYRHHRKSPARVRPERVATPQPRALTPVERKEVKRTLESDEFVDEAPADGLRQTARPRDLPRIGLHHVPGPARARRGA
jgi:putative transposase